MKLIKSIEINKIKGIDNKKLDVSLIANKPNIIVAPNGYGKSSIAAAFMCLQKEKFSVNKDFYYNEKKNDDSFVKIIYQDGNETVELLSNTQQNEIYKNFSIAVINNQITSEAKLVRFNNFSNATSDMIVKDIVLYKTIPKKIKIKYLFSEYREKFSPNQKLSIKLDSYICDENFIQIIYENKKIIEKIINNKGISTQIEKFLNIIKLEKGTKDDIFKKFENDEFINSIMSNKYVDDIMNILNFGNKNQVECIILLIEICKLYSDNKENFYNIIKRMKYEKFKTRITNLFNSYNTRSEIIKIVEKKTQLLAKFPKVKLLSNGEIDIFSFILLLEQCSFEFSKDKCILIIDEIFDYLDDINMITVQSYITRKIKEFKNMGKELYPIIMTHLDPEYFRNFNFSDMKINYLLKENVVVNDDIRAIIVNRDQLDKDNNDLISKAYLHFFNQNISINFNSINISNKYDTSDKFQRAIFNELDKYINNKSCDYIMALCGLRVKIEQYLYENLPEEKKDELINTKETNKKIDFAEKNNVIIPEEFRILSVLYNDIMHISNNDIQQRKIKYVSLKMKHIVINNIIKNCVENIKNSISSTSDE